MGEGGEIKKNKRGDGGIVPGSDRKCHLHGAGWGWWGGMLDAKYQNFVQMWGTFVGSVVVVATGQSDAD